MAKVRGAERVKAVPRRVGGSADKKEGSMWPVLLFGAGIFPFGVTLRNGIRSVIQEHKPPGYRETGCVIKLAFQNKVFLCCNNSL